MVDIRFVCVLALLSLGAGGRVFGLVFVITFLLCSFLRLVLILVAVP